MRASRKLRSSEARRRVVRVSKRRAVTAMQNRGLSWRKVSMRRGIVSVG
jgi:hypothetical protein